MYRFSPLEASLCCAAYRYKSCGSCTNRCCACSVPPLCCADCVHCYPVYCSEGCAGFFLPYFLRLFLYKLVETLKPWITYYYSVERAVSACRTLLCRLSPGSGSCMSAVPPLLAAVCICVWPVSLHWSIPFMLYHNSTASPLKDQEDGSPGSTRPGMGEDGRGSVHTYIYRSGYAGQSAEGCAACGAAIDGGTQEYPVPFSGLDSEVS